MQRDRAVNAICVYTGKESDKVRPGLFCAERQTEMIHRSPSMSCDLIRPSVMLSCRGRLRSISSLRTLLAQSRCVMPSLYPKCIQEAAQTSLGVLHVTSMPTFPAELSAPYSPATHSA